MMNELLINFFKKLMYTLIGALKIVRSTRFNAKKLIPKAEQESCYILGNGPSLTVDMNGILNSSTENFIAVNNFGLSELYQKVKPKYYVITDPFYYYNVLFNEKEQKNMKDLLFALKEKTSWPLIFFAPIEAKKIFVKLFEENKHIKVIVYNKINTWKGFKWFDRWVYNNQWAIISGQNVIVPAISLAINIGFKKIYLLGVDHSWHKNIIVGDDNFIYLYEPHFYDENVLPIPIYIEENKKIRYLKLHEQFEALKKTFEAYHYIQDYAKYKNVKIINCTLNSYIDAFERIKPNSGLFLNKP